MESLASAASQHGYSLLFTIVLLEAIGFPIPAALALLMAGGASVHGPMHAVLSIPVALAALLLGDSTLFLLGRHTGWALLGFLCRLSLNPDSCILRSADAFYKRGRAVLLFAKFVPGINTMAAPLAGSMNMSVWQFFRFDLGGACLYILVYWGAGYVFSDFLVSITRNYLQFSHYLGWTIALLIVGYMAWRAFLAFREQKRGPVTRVPVHEVARNIEDVAIYDVRSHGYYDKEAVRIRGSIRLEPNALGQAAAQLPAGKKIFIYCTCTGDATSKRVARELAGQGHTVSVIAGGLRAWRKAGLPVEPVPADDIVQLPAFS
jgi:membrane protein DedA with SNARE-associated domain/rhodanese-related sulfurtransferase